MENTEHSPFTEK